MRILCKHSDYLKWKREKKAIKEPEQDVPEKGEAKECLVVFMSVEKRDEKDPKAVAKRTIKEIDDICEQLKIKSIMLYPYVHLTNTPSNPATALEVLDLVEKGLKNHEVHRSAFGWYKSFEMRTKGHPMSELSREFGPEEKKTGKDEVFVLSKKKLSAQDKLNLSGAALVGKAVKELYPKAELGVIDLHYDQGFVDVHGVKIRNEDLSRIEKKVKELKVDFKKGKAKGKFQEKIAKDLGKPDAYSLGDLSIVPIYKSPFIATKKIGALKVLHQGSAYWKGNSSNEQLVRIYCAAFSSEKELRKYIADLEEAERKSHKIIGEKLGLFTVFDKVGKGLPIWLPKGEIVRREIEKFAVEMEEKYDYVRVGTPILAKKELFEQSGHLPYYAESMYPSMKMDDGEYYLKSMNCPMHHLIFNHGIRSYRELPLRLAEYGLCHRNELSGTLSGLQRVRCMSMNDAHMYCRKDQIEQEIAAVLKMIQEYYDVFGLKDYWFRLSLSDLSARDKYINEPENWKYSEKKLKEVLDKLKLKYVVEKDEAAFYGPKIDIQFRNAYGKEDTMSTVQLDFVAKTRFGLSYIDEHGKKNNDVFVIHRAPLSTHERFMAFLIEHFEGKFPLWLSPVQVRIVTVSDAHNKFAEQVYKKLKGLGIRVELDVSRQTIGKKVREAQIDKVNYVVTIGDKELKAKKLAIRSRDGKLEFGVDVDKFSDKILKKIKDRAIS